MRFANDNTFTHSIILQCRATLAVVIGVIGLLLGVGLAHGQSNPVLQADNTAGDSTMISFDDGGFAAFGKLGVGTIPSTGAGTRLMWYPRKAAFRVGEPISDEWNDPNVGDYSVAFGIQSVASGSQSFATSNSSATGDFSTALAFGTASGNSSTAIGVSSTASGPNSIAIGLQATASGERCIAIGRGAAANGTGSQSSCMALGREAEATGNNSVALGWRAQTASYGGMALGYKASTGTVSQGGLIINSQYTASGDGPILQGTGQFAARATHFWFGNDNNVTFNTSRLIDTSTGAYLTDGGTWTNSSDSTKKDGFRAVDGEDLLTRLSAVPVQSWRYKTESDDIRHMGPTSQDFHAAFGLGDSDKAISTVDIDGVNMAAIQALERRTRALQEQNEALEVRVASLEASLQHQTATAGLGRTGLGLLIGISLLGGLLVWRRRRA